MGLGKSLVALGRYVAAEPELVAAEKLLGSAQGVPKGRHDDCVAALVTLYEAWERAEPGRGHASTGAKWKGLAAA